MPEARVGGQEDQPHSVAAGAQEGLEELDAWGWCTGMTQRDGTGRVEGGEFRMGTDTEEPPGRREKNQEEAGVAG